MRADVAVITVAPGSTGAEFVARLAERGAATAVLVHASDVEIDDAALDALFDALSAPVAATASPIPVRTGAGEPTIVPVDAHLPPAATLSAPCPRVCLLAASALDSIALGGLGGGDGRTALAELAARLAAHGWRHVAAPGVALNWSTEASTDGEANVALATHSLWTETRLRPVRLLVDGACLTDAAHNGSQAVVFNVARALAATNSRARVTLAVRPAFRGHIAAELAGAGVDVVARSPDVRGFDAVYRPYQLIDPAELDWLLAAADRLVMSQLDMIAFSNPSYHPSAALFHAVRNLQRRVLRLSDAVTFISEFGRTTALAECADLETERLHVVSCGVDAEPITTDDVSATPTGVADGPFVACTSSTFWHKNREHAIAVFAELCRSHGYPGSLVIAGPEPYYGRSTDAEDRLLAGLDPDIAGRIRRVGQVDSATKWWLLRHADVVLYPSVIEGFGLVPFEAAAVDTPSLVYSGSALAEVLGSTPAALTTWSASDWAAAAMHLIGDREAAAASVRAVRSVGARHTWHATAERTWAAIEYALARPPAGRYAEEGGLRSRVAGGEHAVGRGARVTHFVNRLVSYAERQAARPRWLSRVRPSR